MVLKATCVQKMFVTVTIIYRENDTARKQQFPCGSTFAEINCLAASCFSTMAFFLAISSTEIDKN